MEQKRVYQATVAVLLIILALAAIFILVLTGRLSLANSQIQALNDKNAALFNSLSDANSTLRERNAEIYSAKANITLLDSRISELYSINLMLNSSLEETSERAQAADQKINDTISKLNDFHLSAKGSRSSISSDLPKP